MARETNARGAGRSRWRLLPALLILTLAPPSSRAATEWQRVLRIDAADGFTPRSMGFDDSGAVFWLEIGEEKGDIGRILKMAPGGDGAPTRVADGLALPPGRCAMLVWRGRCFLATPSGIRIIDLDQGKVTETVDLSEVIPGTGAETEHPAGKLGFGGLAIGPDARIYGSFTSTTPPAPASDPGGGIVRFEPDGRSVEIVHRGLRNPGGLRFDDSGQARLVDAAEDSIAHWTPLLDGGYGTGGVPLTGAQPAPRDGSPDDDPAWVFWLAKHPAKKTFGLKWAAPDGMIADAAAPDPADLIDGAEIIDLAFDWNGIPHLLLLSDGPDRALEILAFGNPQPSPKTRELLGMIHAHLDDPDAEDADGTEDLAALLGHPDRRIRWQAAWALSGHKEGLPTLASAASGADRTSRHAAIAGIGIIARLGTGAIAPREDEGFAPLPQAGLARRAAEIIGGSLPHPEPETRAHALRVLGSAPGSANLIPFTGLLGDPDPRVRAEALLTGGRLRWHAMLDLLPPAAADDLPSLDPARLADALDALRTPEQLVFYTRHNDPRLRLAAVEALRRHASGNLAHFVFDSDPAVASAAVLAIADRRLESAFPVVAKRLARGPVSDWSPEARRFARRCADAAED